ncbi:tetratricopeptide repeat protein [bacterium]|nr:MAG: tetratricopeptide repeat protein [bacterium]RIK64900.1 MAG: hypothetical protein DCC64_02150 [Planctomycetota bacterium]
MHAETAYLFRHALLRDAAYQLQLPGDRARLHALAFEIIESLHGGRAPAAPPIDDLDGLPAPHGTDSVAAELAQHAGLAAEPDFARWLALRDHYLRRRAALCERAQGREAVEAWQGLGQSLEGQERAAAMARAGYAQWRVGALKEAEAMLTSAQACPECVTSPRVRMLCLLGLVNVLKDSGQASRAEETCNQALAMARSMKDAARECGLLATLAMIYRQTGRVELAEQTMQRGLALARQGGMADNEGTLLGNLAILHGETGRLEEAVAEMRRVLELARKAGDRRMQCIAWGNLANFMRAREQPEEAQAASLKALAIARELGDRRNEAIALRNLGSICAECRQFDDAENYCLRALAILRDIGDRRGEGIALTTASLVYLHTRQPQRALDTVEQALVIHRGTGNRRFEGSALCHEALVRVALGQFDAAREKWRLGSNLLVTVGDSVFLDRVTSQMRESCREADIAPLDD